MLNILRVINLHHFLAGNGSISLLGPTDEAFLALPVAQPRRLLDDRRALLRLVRHYMLEGYQGTRELARRSRARDLEGSDLAVELAGGDIFVGFVGFVGSIGGARLAARDIEATNGVLHLIDRLPLPDPVRRVLDSETVD